MVEWPMLKVETGSRKKRMYYHLYDIPYTNQLSLPDSDEV